MTTVKSRTDAMDSDNNSGTQVSSQIQMYLKHNHDDCLASAVQVFATALGFVINNPNLVTSKKSAEILRDDGSESYLLLKSVETQINTNLRIVTDLSQLKTKQLETRLQDQRISSSDWRDEDTVDETGRPYWDISSEVPCYRIGISLRKFLGMNKSSTENEDIEARMEEESEAKRKLKGKEKMDEYELDELEAK